MSLKSRKIFFFIYVGLFLIIAPLLVFYTAGYRFNFSTGRLVLTGAISASTIPKGAEIYLNDENTQAITPDVLPHVLPGNYTLTLKKDGYREWKREVAIKSRETTLVENAVLFLEAEPEISLPLNAIAVASAPDQETLAYATYEQGWIELWLYNISASAYSLLDRLSANSSSQIVLSWEEPGLTLRVRFLNEPLRNDYYYSTVGAYSEAPVVTTAFQIQKSNGSTLVEDSSGKTIAILPSGDYRITSLTSHTLMLRDETKEALALIDVATSGPPILLQTYATFAHWDKGVLYYGDGIELNRYDPTDNSNTLLTRVGSEIHDAVPFPSANTLIIVFDNTVEAVDFSDLNHPVRTELLTADSIETFWIDSRGRTGYFVGEKNGEHGLFTIRLTK